MYPIAIALLGAMGAWLAWRRNPLYFAASPLRLFAVAILAASALMLLVIAAVDYTGHRAEPVLFTTLLTAVILGTLALLFIMQATSLPRSAQLIATAPPNAPRVSLHRDRVIHWARVLLLLLVLCGVIGALSPYAARNIIFSGGVMLALMAAVALPAMYSNAGRFDRSLSALKCDPWIHWHYSPEQWVRWLEARAVRAPRSSQWGWKRNAGWMIGALGMAAAGLLVFARGSLAERIDYTLLCFGAIALVIILGAHLDRQRSAAFGEDSPEAYFGQDGVYINGLYTLWLGASVNLVTASRAAREPRSVALEFERIVLNPYGPNRVGRLRREVPVPDGCEADLELLQQKLEHRCPKARIALV